MSEQPVKTRRFHLKEGVSWFFLAALLSWLSWQAWHGQSLHLIFPIFTCLGGALFVLEATTGDRLAHIRRSHIQIGSLLLIFSFIVFAQRLWSLDSAASVVFVLGGFSCLVFSLLSFLPAVRHSVPASHD